jgi:hypothetical protein
VRRCTYSGRRIPSRFTQQSVDLFIEFQFHLKNGKK